MPFSVRGKNEIAGLQVGDAISFRLSVTDRDSWIDQIKKISVGDVRLPAPAATPQTENTIEMVTPMECRHRDRAKSIGDRDLSATSRQPPESVRSDPQPSPTRQLLQSARPVCRVVTVLCLGSSFRW